MAPLSITKLSPFEAHKTRKTNTPLSNLATKSSLDNLSWESAKHTCLDQKNLIKPPLPAEILHGLQLWSEDEVSIKSRESKINEKSPTLPKNLQEAANLPTEQAPGAKSKETIQIFKNKLNERYKGVQATIDKHTEKRIDPVARKTIQMGTKVSSKNTKLSLEKF